MIMFLQFLEKLLMLSGFLPDSLSTIPAAIHCTLCATHFSQAYVSMLAPWVGRSHEQSTNQPTTIPFTEGGKSWRSPSAPSSVCDASLHRRQQQEGIVDSKLWIEDREDGHQHVLDRPDPLNDHRGAWVEDHPPHDVAPEREAEEQLDASPDASLPSRQLARGWRGQLLLLGA